MGGCLEHLHCLITGFSVDLLTVPTISEGLVVVERVANVSETVIRDTLEIDPVEREHSLPLLAL